MARPGQHRCHPSQNPRTQPGLLDPLSCAHCVVGNLPSPVSLTHLSQRHYHPSQNPRTLLRLLDTLSHLLSTIKRSDHTTIFTHLISTFK